MSPVEYGKGHNSSLQAAFPNTNSTLSKYGLFLVGYWLWVLIGVERTEVLVTKKTDLSLKSWQFLAL